MKKLIVIFGVFAIICVIVSSFSDNSYISSTPKPEVTETQGASSTEVYTIKSENGRIVVYKGEELFLKTSTAVNTLPKKDERELLYGITVSTKEEMNEVLQDYCS
ncbi:MAG: BofC C-terminal domain-containing protein [Ruminococcus sp.]|nr:BofC C-terminal domain-containing protein [Ruminococcus sp.]MBQ7133950.1 BofC C-terminal domain-containing protein [Ruminococcus sp.]